MDHSNHHKAMLYRQMAQNEHDPVTKREMLRSAKRYEDLDVSAAKQDLKLAKPWAGVRSLLGYICLIAFLLLCAVLVLTAAFSLKIVGGALLLVLVLVCVAAFLSFRVTGHMSEDGMLRGIQAALHAIPGVMADAAPLDGEANTSLKRSNLPAPKVDFDPSATKELLPGSPSEEKPPQSSI